MSKQDYRELEAYRALGKPEELCKKQGWISVKDKPPKLENPQGFLAYFNNSEIRVVNEFQEVTLFRGIVNYYSEKEFLDPTASDLEIIDGEVWRHYRMNHKTVKVKAQKIVYWMPLPEPPKEEASSC